MTLGCVIIFHHDYHSVRQQTTVHTPPSASQTHCTIIVYLVCSAVLFVDACGDRSPSLAVLLYYRSIVTPAGCIPRMSNEAQKGKSISA